jgi:hypothetical protein
MLAGGGAGATALTAVQLEPRDRHLLRELADRITRYVEDLDAGRERAGVVHDQLATTSRTS